MGIYVEIPIRADMASIWRHTQEPQLHERWDLRFTTIEYLPRGQGPQRFLYTTRVGGLKIAGEGESVTKTDDATGIRTSSLTFGSAAALSLIKRGSGYWRYEPMESGVRFLTWYDYETRFGAAGALADRLAFRPLLGWATAWSFDRLRLWLESGVEPAAAFRQAVSHGVSRTALAAIFAYHGLVPKLVAHDPGEFTMLLDAGVSIATATRLVNAAGVAELLLAVVLIGRWTARWPLLLTLGLMAAATLGAALLSPQLLTQAFNPVTLNLGVVALAVVDLANLRNLPSAGRCRRRPGSGA